jgi:hypothetical protein
MIFSRSVILSRPPVSSSFKMLTITSLSVSSKSISNITEKTQDDRIMELENVVRILDNRVQLLNETPKYIQNMCLRHPSISYHLYFINCNKLASEISWRHWHRNVTLAYDEIITILTLEMNHMDEFFLSFLYIFWMLTITLLSVSSKSISNITEQTQDDRIMELENAVISSRSVVLSRTPVSSSFKRYTWNIVLKGVKHQWWTSSTVASTLTTV